MAFALSQDSSLTGLTNYRIQSGTYGTQQIVSNTTHGGSTTSEFCGGRYFPVLSNVAAYWQSNGSGCYPKPIGVGSGLTFTNSPFGDVLQAAITKRIKITPAASGAVPQGRMVYASGRVEYDVAIVAILNDDEYSFLGASGSEPVVSVSGLVLPFDGTHSVSADAVMEFAGVATEFPEGGGNAARWIGKLSGTVTLGGSYNPLTPTSFSSVAVDPDNGVTYTGDVVFPEMQVVVDYLYGTPTAVRWPQMFYNGAVVRTPTA